MCHLWTRQINNSSEFCVVIGHPSYSVNTPGVKLHIQSAGSWVFLQVKIRKMVETTTSIHESSTENPQLENKFTPLSQKAFFWGFLLPAIFSLCPSILQMQTISRRAVTLPASKKKPPISNIGGRWKDRRREPWKWQGFVGGSCSFAQADLRLWLMRRRCRPHTWLCDVQWWTWGRLNRVVLGWFGPDAAWRTKRLRYHPTLIFFECFVSAKRRWVTDFT